MAIIESTYPVQGLRCSGCADKVQNLLESLEGVKSADVHRETETVTLVYNDDNTDMQEAVTLLDEKGYTLLVW